MNVCCWIGPLPNADALSETVLLVSDNEASECAFLRDSNAPDGMTLYVVKFTAVNNMAIEVAAWCTTSKTMHTMTHHPVVMLPNHNMAPTMGPGNRRSEPWTWQIPTVGIEDLVLLHQLKLLPFGWFDVDPKGCAAALRKLPSGK